MVKVAIRSQGTIGKVSVSANPRTTIADPKFKPKPNVALTELVDVDPASTVNVENGDVVTYDGTLQKFVIAPINQAQVEVKEINGGSF